VRSECELGDEKLWKRPEKDGKHGENGNGSTPGILTKAIIEKQEHIGLAR